MAIIKKAVLFLGLLLTAVLLQGCEKGDCENPAEYLVKEGVIRLDKEGTLACDLCDERGLHNRIIVLESKYCGACRAAKPLITEASKETGAEVVFLDLAEAGDNQKITALKVIPYYTPTMLADCRVYIGGKSKEEYKKIFEEFLKESK